MWPLDVAPLAPEGALRPGSVGAVTSTAFACSRALAFYRPSIGWSKLGLAPGGRSGDAVWLRRLLRRSEPLGAQPSFHLHYDAPRSEQTRSRPSTASIEAPLHSASATQIGPLETTTQTRGLTFASPMGRSHALCHQQLCTQAVPHKFQLTNVPTGSVLKPGRTFAAFFWRVGPFQQRLR